MDEIKIVNLKWYTYTFLFLECRYVESYNNHDK